jgi:RNase P subunit RPR2
VKRRQSYALSDGPKKLTCKFCGALLRGWGNLRRHIRREHADQEQTTTI